MAKRITVWKVAEAMVEAGLFTQEEINATRRIVIDLNVDAMPVMYIERYADEELLSVFSSLGGIQIKGTENFHDLDNTGPSEDSESEPEEASQGGQVEERPDPIREFVGDLAGKPDAGSGVEEAGEVRRGYQGGTGRL